VRADMPDIDVYEAVKQVLVDELKLDASVVRPDANLRRDLGLDSLDVTTVAMALEERLGVQVTDDAMQDVETVADAVALLSSHIPADEPSGA
jgi:acyl carrier protein